MKGPASRSVALVLVLVCCLQQLLSNGCQAAAAPKNNDSKLLAQPDFNLYLRKDDLLRRVREVVSAHPDIMKYETRHAKDEDYKADIMVVTVEPSGLRPTHKSKARLLLDFGEHGREFITSEVGLRLLEVLGNPDRLAQLVGGGKRAARLQAILQQCVFKILPMENVAGRDLVEGGNLCERKNGRGVDPNRNWDIDWGVKEKDYDPKEEYPGKGPLSEPEVQVLLALAKQLKPHVWLNVHSGMYALFTPYDHKGHVPNTTDARAALRMMKRIQELSCPQCKVGSGGHTVGYLAHGTATDYMFEILNIPMAFTWEIYGDEDARYEDCFRMFNPLGKEHFDQVAMLWVKALLQLVELLPTHPATWPYFKKLGLERWENVAPGNATAQQQAGAGAATPATQEQQQQQDKAGKAAEGAGSPIVAAPASESKAPAASPEALPQQSQPKQEEAPTLHTPTPQPQPDMRQQGPPPAVTVPVPKSQVQEQQQPAASSSADSTDEALEAQLSKAAMGEPSSTGSETLLVLSAKYLPWLIGLLGFGGVLWCVTHGGSSGYKRLPVRQPLPAIRRQ